MVDRTALVARYLAVRARTELLASPLSAEDQQLQAMPSASPTKWHRGHTTWFFETFLLGPHGVAPYEPSVTNAPRSDVNPRSSPRKR